MPLHHKTRRYIFAYAMLLPGIIFLLVFTFYPIIFGLPLAFTNYSALAETQWVGWRNFERAFADADFLHSLKNSLLYVIVVPVIQFVSILMAILVNNNLKGVQFFRVAYFIPVVTSMVAVAIAWKWMFEEKGIVNYILKSVGLIDSNIAYLNNIDTALFAVMFVTVWKGLGYYMMIYLAGLQSIPSELQEAARIDGANRYQVIWHVTIPLLKPFVLLCSLLSVMAAIRVFDEVYVMTGGGPANSSMVTGLYTYNKAFKDFDFGYAAAIGLIVALIVFVFTVLTFKFGKKGGLNYYG
ncbi:carbohydrate ABC transporter permease [Paenibacillus alkalitolerans]|uniref:carbohydrate ABC transporter permease n=1 Tax=Paenibacillus alkalitolerans TaxID=2799335 RepID=UPI002D80C9BC|nr:sugar ABC transporter permease [Paenibacillus alkalitolerans]